MKILSFPAFLRLTAAAVLALTAGACGVRPREDIRWVEYSVPALAGEDCSRELLRVVKGIDGVLEVNPDLVTHKLSVQYNSRVLAQKNIEHGIAAGGFDVNDTLAVPAAKAALPTDCQ